MCVNFTFSSLLSQRESLGSFSGLTPPPSPASHPGICRPWRGGIFADCRCGVLALRLKLQESQLTWAVMLTKDTHSTHPISTPCPGLVPRSFFHETHGDLLVPGNCIYTLRLGDDPGLLRSCFHQGKEKTV